MVNRMRSFGLRPHFPRGMLEAIALAFLCATVAEQGCMRRQTPHSTGGADSTASSSKPASEWLTVDNPPLPDGLPAESYTGHMTGKAFTLEDGGLVQSGQVPETGDLRPIWILSGRIVNTSAVDIAAFKVRVSVCTGPLPKGTLLGLAQWCGAEKNGSVWEVVDDAPVEVDVLVPAYSVRSFRQDVRLTAPNAKWQWSWELDAVKETAHQSTQP